MPNDMSLESTTFQDNASAVITALTIPNVKINNFIKLFRMNFKLNYTKLHLNCN